MDVFRNFLVNCLFISSVTCVAEPQKESLPSLPSSNLGRAYLISLFLSQKIIPFIKLRAKLAT